MANLTTKDYIPEFTCIPARNPLVAKPAVSFVRRPPENGLGSQEQAAVSKAVVQLAAGARCHFSTRNFTLSVRTLTDESFAMHSQAQPAPTQLRCWVSSVLSIGKPGTDSD